MKGIAREGKLRVWTRQHENVWKLLEEKGRYTAKRSCIALDMPEFSEILLRAYDWLVKNSPAASEKPRDADYPIWLSFDEDTVMLPGEKELVLELEVESSLITPIHITKWGEILNYSYLPENAEDERRHRELLRLRGIDDARAVMTQFYPEIRREIMESWKRLFDEEILFGSRLYYGNIWEIRREWVKNVRN